MDCMTSPTYGVVSAFERRMKGKIPSHSHNNAIPRAQSLAAALQSDSTATNVRRRRCNPKSQYKRSSKIKKYKIDIHRCS